MDFEKKELGSELAPLNFSFYKQQLRSLTKPCSLMLAKLEQSRLASQVAIKEEGKKCALN